MAARLPFGSSRHELFLAKVACGAPDECWGWTAHRNARGYGQFHLDGGRLTLAHRYALALVVAPPFAGACALHKCDNPPCCNPTHLYWGTRADNGRDAAERNRMSRRCGDQNHMFVDVTGRRFGRLIAESWTSRGDRVVWNCRCDCGRISRPTTHSLLSDRARSCGLCTRAEAAATRRLALIDRRFGRLVVVARELPISSRLWLAQCDCGAIRLVNSSNLLTGATRSCGSTQCRRAASVRAEVP